MEVNQIQTGDVDSFFKQFTQDIPTNSTQQAPQGAAAFGEIINDANPNPDPNPSPEGEKTEGSEEVDKLLEGQKKEEEKPSFFQTPIELAEKLLAENILYPYEDGTKPQTTEEVIEALKQSSLYNAQQEANKIVEEKFGKYSPALQAVIEYGDNGITSATELQKFIGQVSQFEQIASLDPKNEKHQEQIVYMQLINNGFDDQGARDEIADLKERKRLSGTAEKYHPLLANAYKAQVEKSQFEKRRQIEEEHKYVETNHGNVSYFLEHEDEFVPFKVPKKDKYTAYELAARPVDYTPEGEAVYGWQRYLESLQFGDEKSFKEYMKIMTFIANSKSYDEGVKKVATNATKTQQFKNINTGGKSNEFTKQEPDAPVIRKPSTSAWNTKG